MNSIDNTIDVLCSDAMVGYGPSPIPSPIDNKVRELIETVFPIDGSAHTEIISKLKERHGSVLIAFGARMAAMAVRTGNDGFIQEGLKALAIAYNLIDYREVVLVTSLLYRGTIKLNLDAHKLFNSVLYLNPECRSVIGDFPNRAEEDRTIESMGYFEAQDQDGFRFKRNW